MAGREETWRLTTRLAALREVDRAILSARDPREIAEETLSLDAPYSVADLIDEIARDTEPPDQAAAEPLISRDHVSEALEDFFQRNAPYRKPVEPPPETLPDEAVPPGLVRPRQTPPPQPEPQPPVPEAPASEEGGKKKGLFRKLFGG